MREKERESMYINVVLTAVNMSYLHHSIVMLLNGCFRMGPVTGPRAVVLAED